MNGTAFDPARFQLPPEVADKLARAKPKHRGKKTKRIEPFLQIPHRAIKAGAEVLGSSEQLLVWLYIHHRMWADKSSAVVIANKALEDWGVSRRAKYAALINLERARLIYVERRERKSPVVSLA
jgi:hypothetical protein